MRTFITTLVVILFTIPSFAQQSGPSLKGIWKVDFAATVAAMDTASSRKFSAMPVARREQVTAAFTGRSFHFADSNAVTIAFTVNGIPNLVNGQWTQGGVNMLTITASGTTKNYTVIWHDQNTILLQYETTGDQWLLKSLTLKRQN